MPRIYFYEIQEAEKTALLTSLAQLEISYVATPLEASNIPSDAEVVSVFTGSKLTREVLAGMPNLKLVITRSTRYDHIDMLAAEERAIIVTNIPSYGENTVAEYAFGLLLSLTRKIPDAVKLTRESVCVPAETVRGVDLSLRKLGIMGVGRIGRRMVAMGRGFGMEVIAYDVHQDAEAAEQLGFQYVSKEKLLAESDVITLHMSASPENHHILDRAAFEAMKTGVYIVNTAQGELIETRALIDALQSGKVAGAGLDVCEGEELLNHKCSIDIFSSSNSDTLLRESAELSILKAMPNVLLTPHVAFDSIEALERICTTTSANLLAYQSGAVINQVRANKIVLGKLVLVRHTESEWNAKSVWTGSRDVFLSEKGFEDARLLGKVIENIHIDHAYSSAQVRTLETLSSMLGAMRQLTVPITRSKALNERDYGDYTGKNKNEMRELFGDQFDNIRRGWNVPIPNGETLKMVFERVVPYYQTDILPRILRGENVLIVSHGNALRALMKYVESLSDEEIEQREMLFGGAVVYTLDEEGHSLHTELRETPSLSSDHA